MALSFDPFEELKARGVALVATDAATAFWGQLSHLTLSLQDSKHAT